jgi:hypothetical protein
MLLGVSWLMLHGRGRSWLSMMLFGLFFFFLVSYFVIIGGRLVVVLHLFMGLLMLHWLLWQRCGHWFTGSLCPLGSLLFLNNSICLILGEVLALVDGVGNLSAAFCEGGVVWPAAGQAFRVQKLHDRLGQNKQLRRTIESVENISLTVPLIETSKAPILGTIS